MELYRSFLNYYYKNRYPTLYMGRRGGAATMDEAFKEICKQLKKFKRIYDHNDFEKSWDDICEMLDISKDPRFNTNVSTDNFIDNIPQDFKDWHRDHARADFPRFRRYRPAF